MSVITRTPIRYATVFATPRRRTGVVHRIRSAELTDEARIYATWRCGEIAVDAVLLDDPAPFGMMCRYCEEAVTGTLVYHCYSACGQLLYIGSCVRWSVREALHIRNTPWWPEVARVEKTAQPDLPAARLAEAAAIRTEAPLYNKQHNVKRFKMAGHEYVPLASAA